MAADRPDMPRHGHGGIASAQAATTDLTVVVGSRRHEGNY
jgi:hypothetical protein